mmetsp:Transcript_46393/g.131200  ORF Transcript_46393/g.131200 Transcript_46393/m.131200 type:complete len:280 (+) Transcript_46393:179-1018(+)
MLQLTRNSGHQCFIEACAIYEERSCLLPAKVKDIAAKQINTMLDIGRQARGGGQCGFVEAGPDLDARGRAVGQYEGKGHDRTANTAAKVEETLPWTHVQVGDERGEGRETHLAGDEAPRGHRVAPQLLRRGMREVRDASEDLAVAAVHTHGHVLRSATRALQAATTGPVPARNDVVEVEPGHWRPHINVWRRRLHGSTNGRCRRQPSRMPLPGPLCVQAAKQHVYGAVVVTAPSRVHLRVGVPLVYAHALHERLRRRVCCWTLGHHPSTRQPRPSPVGA